MKFASEKYGCNGPEASWLKNTLLFRQWEGMKEEILLHKWYESERAGYDIGWERAAVDWMIKHGPVCARSSRSRTGEQF